MQVQVTLRCKLKYDLDTEIGRRALRQHIKDAVICWGGSLDPDDPLFDGIFEVTTSAVTVSK